MQAETIYGIHPVLEVLQAERRQVEKLLVAVRRSGAGVRRITALAAQRGIPVSQVEPRELRHLLGHDQHQGVVALVRPLGYEGFDAAVTTLTQTPGPHTWLLLDGVTDVGNFATLIRSAVAFGVEVIALPRHHSVGLTPVVAKRSAGAVEKVSVVQVGNVARALESLKQAGCWVYGTAAHTGSNVGQVRWPERLVLIIGSEGRGMRRLVRERCDEWIRIPMSSGVDSLNAAVAGSIVLSHIWAHRAAALTDG
jgi:23S rRNA (guanosine2251-2'-O)-methyltransferase